MNTQTIDKQSMEALKTLAETNVKIGEAKGILEALKGTESKYLDEREKKALAYIDKAFADSSDLLDKLQNNYAEVNNLLATVNSFVSFLEEIQEKTANLMSDFDQKADLWEENAKKREDEIADLKRKVEVEQKHIEIDKKTIKKGFENLEKIKKGLDSRQGLLERNIKRLKEGKI